MRTHEHGRALLWVLGVTLVVAVILATRVELEKRKLATAYHQLQTALSQLEQERAHLSQDLLEARQTMDEQANDVSRLHTELGQLQIRLAQTEQEITQLQRDQQQLAQANMSLTEQLGLATQEKQLLEAQLSSLNELKAAIHLVKQKMWQERWHAWLAKMDAQRLEDERRLARGNRGFVVHNGTSTLGVATKLQVRVLEPQAQ